MGEIGDVISGKLVVDKSKQRVFKSLGKLKSDSPFIGSRLLSSASRLVVIAQQVNYSFCHLLALEVAIFVVSNANCCFHFL